MSAVRLRIGSGNDAAALVRGAERAESILLFFDPALGVLETARARAAIGPLAVELAPATRVNALVPSADAHPEDVETAARFLEGARSTTGQVLEISARA